MTDVNPLTCNVGLGQTKKLPNYSYWLKLKLLNVVTECDNLDLHTIIFHQELLSKVGNICGTVLVILFSFHVGFHMQLHWWANNVTSTIVDMLLYDKDYNQSLTCNVHLRIILHNFWKLAAFVICIVSTTSHVIIVNG